MTLDIDYLRQAVDRNDVRAVAAHLRGSSEAERRAVSARVRAIGRQHWDFQGNRAAAAIAVLGTAGGARAAAAVLSVVSLGDWNDEAVAVLADRSPAWLSDLPAAFLPGHLSQWLLVRAMVRTGLVPPPDAPEYITKMPWALGPRTVQGEPVGKSIEEHLLEDRGLLQDEVFRLFHVEGAGRALYWADYSWAGTRRPGDTWRETLARLARAGAIDFDRLLDECLGAFVRDFRPSQLGWYAALHEELGPSLDEMSARCEIYARLLAAEASIGIGVGQAALEALLRAGRLDVSGFILASGPPLHRAEKGIVRRHLKLLGLALNAQPESASLIRDVIAPALSHERPELREAARAFASRLPAADAQDRAAPALEPPLEDDLARREGELRARAARLTNVSPWAEPIRRALAAVDSGVAPAAEPISTGPGTRLPPPITNPEELVVAFTKLVEDARDPVLLERALAAAVRTARIPLTRRTQLAGPLANRAKEQLPGYPSGLTGGDVRAMVASVAYTWATGARVNASFPETCRDFALQHTSVDEQLKPVTLTGVFAVRAIEVIYLVASGASVELLSEPTHERGAIEPAVFVERARAHYDRMLGPSPPRYDLELAALQLGRFDRAKGPEVLPRKVRTSLGALLRTLPAEMAPAIVSGRPIVERWKRQDPVVLAAVPPTGCDGGIATTLTNLEEPLATYARFSAESEFSSGYGASIGTWPLIAPWHPELVAAHRLRPLSRGLRSGRHDLAASAVACLGHGDAGLGAIGHLALALGCIGAEGDTRTSAADVVGQAARDGRRHQREQLALDVCSQS